MKKNTLRFCLGIWAFFGMVFSASAQQILRGALVDEASIPIENGYVFQENCSCYYYTDNTGRFTLESAEIGTVLRFGALGYEKSSLRIKKQDFENNLVIKLSESAYQLKEVVVRPDTEVLTQLLKVDVAQIPVKSSQEILQKVPGIFIAQHAGGGKAEQIFLRGFDLDHGTDIRLTVDGIPVNMVSHAHGQGYSDLHHVIPETIAALDFGKGPHSIEQGNFATAGYVDFKTKSILEENQLRLESGSFGRNRALAMFNLLNTPKQKAYFATEALFSEGYFDAPQDFERLNVSGKYRYQFDNGNALTFSGQYFDSSWDASGQIPERAGTAGQIGRFGAIDATEGGNTTRTTLGANYVGTVGQDLNLDIASYWSYYDFQLFSNFTFFLNDPENGDRIRQSERRNLFGTTVKLSNKMELGEANLTSRIGLGFRLDEVRDNDLSRMLDRTTVLERIQLGDITENNNFLFLDTKLNLDKWSFQTGMRLDRISFEYQNALTNTTSKLEESQTILSPKASVQYSPNERSQYFVKASYGFHSNDTRSVVFGSSNLLAKAFGVDVGTLWKPLPSLVVNATAWTLFSDDELVYVGDEGVVEPSGKSRRYGVDLGFRGQFKNNLYCFTDATFSHARSLESPSGEDYIPLAPNFTLAGGVGISNEKGLSGGLRYRYLRDRAANEDFSLVASGYFLTDLNLNYRFSKHLLLEVIVENLFDVDWNEAQFATTSRLQNETSATEEIHFTPGSPLALRTGLTYTF